MSTIAGLRAATWASHQRLEKRLDVKARFSNFASYRAHLEHMWGFCAALESNVAASLQGVLADFESRRKLPLLRRDLLALGSSAAAIDALPLCPGLPRCEDAAQSFGCLYVIEGATLGGRTLLPMVQSRLGMTAEHGASFLASYGDAVGTMWRTFGAALDACCSAPEHRDRAACAAAATFGSLDLWLCADGS
jgi:heme oxygenase (biliverdin-IX-beta and delta-forming)